MKISQDMKSQTELNIARPKHAETRSFQKLVQSEALHLRQQELEKIVQEITIQGEKLARYRTLKELAKFKRLIKGFLQETISGSLKLQQRHSIGFDGTSRKLTIVKEIDEKLVELTEDVMNQEKKTVDILGLIGEIKGLIINLYT